MENLVPRLIGAPEATRLGIKNGWYGTRVSGTLMTGPCESLAACVEAIDLIPEPAKIIEPVRHDVPIVAQKASQNHFSMSTQPQTAYQIGRRPAP